MPAGYYACCRFWPAWLTASMDLAYRTCPLCEAVCGLELGIKDGRIARVRGDREHVLSGGFLCPKGAAFGQLVHDPDRLRRPLVRTASGWDEVGWLDAFAAVDRGMRAVVERDGNEAVALYVGNPNVHTMAGGLFLSALIRAWRTPNVFSASTVDQMPKHVSCGYLFGNTLAIPVPDIDHTDFMILLGANPWESNGSLCTAPDFPGRLEALQARGGRFVVVDPKRTKTAAVADEHLAIRPGADAYLLFAMVNTLFDEGLVDLGQLGPLVEGVEDVARLAKEFPPEAVSARCGIEADRIRWLARELSRAECAAVYGRMGTSTVAFGTLANWLVDVLNVLTGNLDRRGGAMFPLAAHQRRPPSAASRGAGFASGRWQSRVRGLPEVRGELPVATLADEIETPGPGQVRALFTVAGNPARSTPNSARVEAALASLDFMVSIDPYLNETTRFADVILPPPDPARSGHYDFSFLGLAVRNFVAYSPPVFPPDPDGIDEAEILTRLTLIAEGAGPDADVEARHEEMLRGALERATADAQSPAAGRDVDELRSMITGDDASERLLDAQLRLGPYGDGFGADPDGLSLERLRQHPHGIDLGPLQPRLPGVLRTASGKIELCAEPLAADVRRLSEAGRVADDTNAELVLIGRRQLRSNNSWMHNVPVLVKGKERCTLQVHPEDAKRLGLRDGGSAQVASRAGTVLAPVEVTDEVLPGVVSLPHGWGHGVDGSRMSVAGEHAGVNSNVLADETSIDPLSGNAVLNGIPVEVRPA
jgi:anaerobic selenocysteine-containing dehydrogenase